MKKLIFLLIPLLFSGCNSCDLSRVSLQVPSLFIYAGADCNAMIPDFTTLIPAVDNCKLAWYTQEPPAGTLLTPDNNSAMVTLRAGDVSGNVAEMSVLVTLVDTIKPVFNVDPALLLASWEAIDKMYDQGDRVLKQMVFHDEILNTDTSFLPRQVGNSYFSGIDRRVYPVRNASTSKGVISYNDDGVLQVDSAFLAKTLVIRVPYEGKRTFTFE